MTALDAPTVEQLDRGRALRATPMSSITMRATRWLWREQPEQSFTAPLSRPHDWLPLGGLCLLAGKEGTGKSTWTYHLAAKVTCGTLPGAFHRSPRSVVVVASEDSYEHTIVPRLVAAGADLDRVYRVDALVDDIVTSLTLPEDITELHRLCVDRDIVMVLLDPLMSTLANDLDSHKDHDVRVALEPLSRLAHDAQVTILGLIHENKSKAADILARIMASKAFTAVARTVLVCAAEQSDDDDRRETYLFGQAKNNLGAKVPESLRYHIEGMRVGHDPEVGEDIWSSRVVVDDSVTGRITDLISEQENRATQRETVTDRAEKWLRTFLKSGVPVPSAEVKAAAKRAGFSESAIKRSLTAADVVVTPIPGTHNQTTWSLSGEEAS